MKLRACLAHFIHPTCTSDRAGGEETSDPPSTEVSVSLHLGCKLIFEAASSVSNFLSGLTSSNQVREPLEGWDLRKQAFLCSEYLFIL